MSGLERTKLVSGSARIASPLVWKNIVGTPDWCSGSQIESGTVDWPTVTATTSSSTIWLAQSVPAAGSAPVSHVTSSIGLPAMPPRCSFHHSTVASAA